MFTKRQSKNTWTFLGIKYLDIFLGIKKNTYLHLLILLFTDKLC